MMPTPEQLRMLSRDAQARRDYRLNPLLRLYEHVTRPFTPYGYRDDLPRYSLTHRTNDGIIRGWPRFAHHLIMKFWFAFMLTTLMIALHFNTMFALLSPLVVNLLIKIGWVLSGRYMGDPFDWFCDILALTLGGSLLALHLFTPYAVSPLAAVELLVVYIISYPWATP